MTSQAFSELFFFTGHFFSPLKNTRSVGPPLTKLAGSAHEYSVCTTHLTYG